MLKFLLSTILASSLHALGANDSFTKNDYKFYLTGNSSKTWYMYATVPESTVPSCKVTHPLSADNTYTFFANGRFEFNHGAITKDTVCEENCCSDLVNFTGKWKFTNDKTMIKVIDLAEKGKPENTIAGVLFENANISQLDENVLRFSQVNPETNEVYTCEFRAIQK